MPVSVLLVEGNLDVEILFAVFQGQPPLRSGGSKNSLKPQAKSERKHNGVSAGYLRDRDFDYEPPHDSTVAVIDSTYNDGEVLGWRWARHEIENYLIEPAIAEAAIGIPAVEWSRNLVETALRIRWYQVARWTIGQMRRSVPPSYRLETRPAELNELQLPDRIGEEDVRDWCVTSIRSFAAHVEESMSEESVEASIQRRAELLTLDFLSHVTNVLMWCSGKDLLAGLNSDVLARTGCENAGALRARLRDWVRENAHIVVRTLPEWQNLVAQVRS